MPKNPAEQLLELGQSVWYDNISRDLLQNGELKRLVSQWGVRGLTSNPTIFDQAIRGTNLYDADIARLRSQGASAEQIFDCLAKEDISQAADVLRPVYDESAGDDGFVSIEVSPLLAADTGATIEQARRLYAEIGRPNVMIKVPGTSEGLLALQTLIEDGINVNVTLLFSVENYVAVANTYCEALRSRLRKGLSLDGIRSVASFFVSRVDTIVDKALEDLVRQTADSDKKRRDFAVSLMGKFGVANSKLAYKEFRNIFCGASFSDLQKAGAAVQRPLWASTGTKNSAYRDVLYIEELIGPNTVNTIPHKTLAAFMDHGVVKETLTTDLAGAEEIYKNLLDLGVDVPALLEHLQEDGVAKFSESFFSLSRTIAEKCV